MPDIRFHDPGEMRYNAQVKDCDLILLRHKAEAEWVGEFLAARMLHHAYQPVVAVTDEFSAALVLQMNNFGADRVIPMAEVRALLPECLESFFPEICRDAHKRLGEAQGEYAFEGLSGIPRFLRTEKTSLVFVERLLDTLDALVVVLTPDGNIVFLNQKCEAATGYHLADVAGRLVSEVFLLPEETDEVMQVLSDLRNNKYPNQHQNSWLTREGKELRIEWSNTALIDDSGKVGYVIAMGLDITEFYRQAQELRATGAALCQGVQHFDDRHCHPFAPRRPDCAGQRRAGKNYRNCPGSIGGNETDGNKVVCQREDGKRCIRACLSPVQPILC